jgi:hypothetical protein
MTATIKTILAGARCVDCMSTTWQRHATIGVAGGAF